MEDSVNTITLDSVMLQLQNHDVLAKKYCQETSVSQVVFCEFIPDVLSVNMFNHFFFFFDTQEYTFLLVGV